MTRVEPVETRSTIASARPSRGATSTAPEIGMMSTAMPRCCEEPPRGVRVGRRDAQAGEVLDASGTARRSGRRRRAGSGRSRASRTRGSSAPVSREEVDAGDAEVGDAVADELDDVVRAHEQDVEIVVLDARDEAPVVLLEDEAGVVQEPQGRFDEPALVRDGQPQALALIARVPAG